MKKYYIKKIKTIKTDTGWGWVVLERQTYAPHLIRVYSTEQEAINAMNAMMKD